MADAPEDSDLRRQMQRLESLLAEVDRFADPNARAKTREIVQALMDFHRAALERLMDRLADSSESGPRLIQSVAEDELVANMLLLYDLHPLGLADRVAQALEKVRPYLHSHGGNVQLIGIDEGVVQLRLEGSCHGCPSSAQTLKQRIEEAIFEIAPDVSAIEVVENLSHSPVLPRGEARGLSLPILAAS